MAWTEKLPSGRYRGSYRLPDGTTRRAPHHYVHKAQALRAAAELEAASRKLGWRDPQAAARTWGDWCTEWQTTRILSPSTKRDEQSSIKNHLRPRWEDTPLIDITRHDVKAWAADLISQGKALATVKKITTALSTSLAAAVDAEILTSNPAARLKLGTPDNTIERYLTRDEQTALIDAHTDHPLSHALTTVLIDSGLRWGEATALTASDIDLEKRTIRVRNAWSEGVLMPYPKGKRRRTVPLTQRAAAALAPIMPAKPSALILSYDGTTQLDGSAWRRRHHEPAVDAAGLEHTRIHDLRHTYASTLLQAGISLADVGKLMGHVSVLTTARYAHLSDTPSAAVLTALGDQSEPEQAPDPEPERGAIMAHPATAGHPKRPKNMLAEVIDFRSKHQIRR